MRSRFGLGVIAVALGLVSFGLVPGAASSAHASEKRVSYYGSISLAYRDNAVGYSYDYHRKRAAIRHAYHACRTHSRYPGSCHKIVWVRNGCAALAVRTRADGSVRRYGWGVAGTRRAAYRAALRKCGPRCVRRVYTCTTRP